MVWLAMTMLSFASVETGIVDVPRTKNPDGIWVMVWPLKIMDGGRVVGMGVLPPAGAPCGGMGVVVSVAGAGTGAVESVGWDATGLPSARGKLNGAMRPRDLSSCCSWRGCWGPSGWRRVIYRLC